MVSYDTIVQIVLFLLSAFAVALSFYVRSEIQRRVDAAGDTLRAELSAEIEKGRERLVVVQAALETAHNALDKRCVQTESLLQDIPRGRDIGRIDKNLATMAGNIQTIEAQLTAQAEKGDATYRLLTRLENHIFKLEG